MDGRLEDELKAIVQRMPPLLQIVLEHFGDAEDRFDELEKMISDLRNADVETKDGD